MLIELFDDRIAKGMSEKKYSKLKKRAEGAYIRIIHGAPASVLLDLAELIKVAQEIESKLLGDHECKNTISRNQYT